VVPHDHLDALQTAASIVDDASGDCGRRHPLRPSAATDAVEHTKKERPKGCGGYELSL
jgi:hypothetical protein